MYDMAESQMTLYDYVQPFGGTLDENNRWVKLAKEIDWQEMERHYAGNFGRAGNQALPLRMAFGSLVIRQALELSDRQTVQMIRENPYLQYFIGLDDFTEKPPFSVRSMTAFRRRIPEKQVARAARMLNQR